MAFKPALLVVDMQNDFCTPSGSIPVSGNGMDLVAPIKELLSMPGFAMRITTLNEVPESHKVLAHNHEGAKPWETHVESPNAKKGMGHQTVKIRTWPKFCLRESWGAQLVYGLQESDFDLVVRRNTHDEVAMRSPLKDIHGNDKNDLPEGAVSHHLADELASNDITDVFCVGTAGDLCVSHTALDIASAGFKAYVIEDVTMSFDAGKGWPAMKKGLETKGVEVVTLDGPEIGKVKVLEGGKPEGGQKAEAQGKHGSATTMVFRGNFNGPVFFGYSVEQTKVLMKTA